MATLNDTPAIPAELQPAVIDALRVVCKMSSAIGGLAAALHAEGVAETDGLVDAVDACVERLDDAVCPLVEQLDRLSDGPAQQRAEAAHTGAAEALSDAIRSILTQVGSKLDAAREMLDGQGDPLLMGQGAHALVATAGLLTEKAVRALGEPGIQDDEEAWIVDAGMSASLAELRALAPAERRA